MLSSEFMPMLQRLGISDLFLFALASFWLAKFVLGQDWKSEETNNLRNAISIALYLFGVCLLIAILAGLPQCSRTEPQAEERQRIQPAQAKASADHSGKEQAQGASGAASQ